MKATLSKLRERLEEGTTEMTKLRKAIEAMQNVCEHDWVDNGRDSHKDHYVCTICGKTDMY